MKSKKAADRLFWLRAEKVTPLEAGTRKAEQDAYAEAFAQAMREIAGD